MSHETDTPRTDAARFEALQGAALRKDCIPLKLGQELERKLTEAEAEVERLSQKLSITEDELADAREWLDERYKATSEADERAEKAEAEVKRLRSNLGRAVEIAEGLEKYGIHELTDDLRELKSEIK